MFKIAKSYNWLIYNILNSDLEKSLRKYSHGRLLDIGCGEKPYGNMTKPYVAEHIGLDHENTLHDKSKIDLFGTAYKIPIEDEYFDTVLCTAVLEHLEEPDKAIKEAHRILKSGGHVINIFSASILASARRSRRFLSIHQI